VSGGGFPSAAVGGEFHWWHQAALNFVDCGCQMILTAAGSGLVCQQRRVVVGFVCRGCQMIFPAVGKGFVATGSGGLRLNPAGGGKLSWRQYIVGFRRPRAAVDSISG